jgi:hypothetical protein
MLAVIVRLRSELPGRRRAWLASALLVALFAGVVFAAAAGARRTDSAYSRYLKNAQAADVFVSPFDRLLRGSYDEIRRPPRSLTPGWWRSRSWPGWTRRV